MTILPYLFRPKKANTSANGQTITTATTAANGTTGQQQQWGDENNNHNIIKPITTTKKHKEQKQKIQHIIDTEACNQTGKETWDLSQFQLVETLGTGTFGRVWLVSTADDRQTREDRTLTSTHQTNIRDTNAASPQPVYSRQNIELLRKDSPDTTAYSQQTLLSSQAVTAYPTIPVRAFDNTKQTVTIIEHSPVKLRYFALKVLKKAEVVRLKQVEHINSEKRILSSINFPFIVNLRCTFQDERNIYMLLDYVPGGELFSHLRKAMRFELDTARFVTSEIVLALEYLHNLNIVYRDLKPENILLDERGHVKITDFGFAKSIVDWTWTLCGTPEYLAPEIIQSKGHGKGVDWWALGILLYEMLVGWPPYSDANPFGIYEKILAGRLEFPSDMDTVARDLIKRLLNNDRNSRLGNLRGGTADVKRHRFFRGVDWDLILRKEGLGPIPLSVTHPGDTHNFDQYPPEPPQELGVPIDTYRDLFASF